MYLFFGLKDSHCRKPCDGDNNDRIIGYYALKDFSRLIYKQHRYIAPNSVILAWSHRTTMGGATWVCGGHLEKWGTIFSLAPRAIPICTPP